MSLSSPIASRRVESAVLRLLPSTKTSSSSSVTIAGMLIFTRVGDSKALVKLENEIDFHHKLCDICQCGYREGYVFYSSRQWLDIKLFLEFVNNRIITTLRHNFSRSELCECLLTFVVDLVASSRKKSSVVEE